MVLSARLRGILDWLLEGYPAGVPPKDYVPLIALLRRRLTEDEVRQIAAAIAESRPHAAGDTRPDIGVGITKVTDELPSEDDIRRVERHLTEIHDWPEASGV